MVFRCPNIQAHYNEALIYLNFGTPKNNEFSIWNKWKIYYFLVSQYLSTLGYFILLVADKKKTCKSNNCGTISLGPVPLTKCTLFLSEATRKL